MIKTEMVGDRIRSYSDLGVMIRQEQTGVLYIDAVDIPSIGYTYVETDIPIPREAINIDENTLEDTVRFLIDDGIMITPQQSEPDYFSENEQEQDYFDT